MFPLKDNVESQSLPIVTWLIIALNAIVFLIESFLQTYGLIPGHIGGFVFGIIAGKIFDRGDQG